MVKNPSVQCKRDRTRCAIVEAAIEIIADKGLDAASIEELMRAAGMARGTFYNYFQTRDEVLIAVERDIRVQIREAVESRIPEGLTPAQILTCMVFGFVQYGLDRPQIGWTLVRIGGGPHWLMAEPQVEPAFPRADEALASIIDPDLKYLLAICFIEGVTQTVLRRLLEGRINMEDADRILQLLLRGLGLTAKQIAASVKMAREFADQIHTHLSVSGNRHSFGSVAVATP